ncbi:zwittermicin A synthase ZmaJ-like [Eriocheir sinensis]|uniref:zwittermicin A synthase ZmaJ-like n=1 Tax=Eriocheir sinensis TaxID=95602 RepID=UPI0021C87B43|nr:zwittermicin A synthase ZmaJ-like [Eriocheir sinensis]XP_050686171.1 zwittermicin A synthase ZmaJ-like [Eriocheir sinensis]
MPLHGPRRPLPLEWVAAPRLFQCAALAHPKAPALRDAADPAWLTYHQLDRAANKLARCLLRRLHGVPCANPDGDRVVAVCFPPSARLVTALLAIHKTGAAYLPLDVTFPAARTAHILADARPALLLVHGCPQAAEVALDQGTPVLHLDDLADEVKACSGETLGEKEVGTRLSGDSIAVILYTSGSTGVPKGVRVPHRALLNRLAWQWHTFPYQQGEVCCFKTALTFVDSLSEIFGPLLTGHSLVVVPKAMIQAVDDLVTVLDEAKVGRLVLVPSLLRSILLHCSSSPTAPKLKTLRLWVCSGEVLPADMLHAFFKTFTNGQTICNFYGSTEVMGDVTYLQFHDPREATARLVKNKVPIGSPIDNCRIYLLGADGQVVKEGRKGEVCAAGLNIASGYVGGAQSDKFIPNKHDNDPEYNVLYRTGDFGRVVDGALVFEGRADTQIKVRGHRVDLIEVDMAVKKVKGVDKVTIICYSPGEINQVLLAFYTSDESDLQPEDLKDQLETLLQPYMVPQVLRLQDFPLLVNGKVDRQELLRVYERQAEGDAEDIQIDLAGVQAGSQEEEAARTLLLTVGRVLGPAVSKGTSLSLDTNFFNIGGNSLNSVSTIMALKDQGYVVGIGEFMRATSLGEVLASMRKVADDEGDEEETEVEESGAPVCSKGTKLDQYTVTRLATHHKDQVFDLIANSFSKKGDLEVYLGCEPWEYKVLLESGWTRLVEDELSYVVTRADKPEVVVGCSLNFDVWKEPELEASPKLNIVLEFLEEMERPCREKLPKGPVLHNFMEGTLINTGPAENVELMEFMERENIRMAKSLGFEAVFTTNTSPLTQQMCDDVLSFTVLHNQQVNKYVAPDGTKPFAAASDSQYAITIVKLL